MNEIFISHASIWEMSIKYSIGKLKMPSSARSFQNELLHHVYLNEFQILPIALEHILEVSVMPLFHRDPFDRLLVAQAMFEKMPIISADIALDQYQIQRIW